VAGVLESLTDSGDINIINFENELTDMAESYKVFEIGELLRVFGPGPGKAHTGDQQTRIPCGSTR